MSQGLDMDLKEIVLSNSTFGPNEIEQLTRAIAEDASSLGRAPRLGRRIGDERNSDACDGGPVGCLLLPARPHAPCDRNAPQC